MVLFFGGKKFLIILYKFLVEMFDVRRGAEKIRDLRKADFKLEEDKNFKFKYWKKVS